MEPIFTENKISRGRLKTFELVDLLGELVGKDYDVSGTYESDGGFKFVISKKVPKPPPVA
jgi:hypothetical protein